MELILIRNRPAVDIVSALEFDETGDFLAVGDRGGRVVVFECHEDPAEAPHKVFVLCLGDLFIRDCDKVHDRNTNFMLSTNHTSQSLIILSL